MNILNLKNIKKPILAGIVASMLFGGALIASAQATTTDPSMLSSTTTSITTAPLISSILITPTSNSATITWITDQNANSQIAYGTMLPYNASTTLNSTQMSNHSEMITGLTPNTQYHFAISSTNNSGQIATSSDQLFTTLMSTTTLNQSQFDLLEAEIAMLRNEITVLQNQITLLLNQGNSGIGSSTPPTTSTAMIDQNGQSYSAGGSIDFGGHKFLQEEQVNVSLNGTTVGTAHADREGNFSTGSMSLPTTPGTYIYTFTGANGDRTTATITVR